MTENQKKYVEHAVAMIETCAVGMAIGANYSGLNGREFHYDHSEMGREEIKRQVNRMVKYLLRKPKTE